MLYMCTSQFIVYDLILNLPGGAPMVNELGKARMASDLDVFPPHLMANPGANNLGEALIAANPMDNNLLDVFFPIHTELPWPTVLGKTSLLKMV